MRACVATWQGAIHVLGTLRASAPMPVQQRLAELLRTKSEDYRLQVALLSAIQQFPLEFLVQQLPLIFECLFSDDNEVREAASNIFTTRAKCFQTRTLEWLLAWLVGALQND